MYLTGTEKTRRAGQKYTDFMAVFTITERTYVQEEQYVIYDLMSCFAEIGGFMGLILGSSLLSMYDELNGLISRLNCITKIH